MINALMDALRTRWGGEVQNRQLELLQAFEDFTIVPREDYEDTLTWFAITRIKARDETPHQASSASLTRKLLLLFHVPEDQWVIILAPTQGVLPVDEQQYNEFISYLKRLLQTLP